MAVKSSATLGFTCGADAARAIESELTPGLPPVMGLAHCQSRMSRTAFLVKQKAPSYVSAPKPYGSGMPVSLAMEPS